MNLPSDMNSRKPYASYYSESTGMRRSVSFLCVLIMALSLSAGLVAQEKLAFEAVTPPIVLTDNAFSITVTPDVGSFVAFADSTVPWSLQTANGTVLKSGEYTFSAGNPSPLEIGDIKLTDSGVQELRVNLGDANQAASTRAIPGFLSILPPLLAIAMALITRQAIIALFCGIWLGVTIISGYNPITGFLHTLDTYIIKAFADSSRVNILLFTLLLGGMVGVITRSGGTEGIVDKLARYAKSAKGGQVSTWLMGIFIFFDDYANTLIVGNTMRPLTDKLRISREKLAYLVDSTAAPVANIAIISTWIGYEISLIDIEFKALGISSNAYAVFLQTIPYNFYPLYTLLFGFLIAFLARDYGPMWQAENRARTTGAVQRANATPLANLTADDLVADENTPRRWYNAVIPVLTVIVVTLAGLAWTGLDSVSGDNTDLTGMGLVQQLGTIFGAANSFAVLMWASFIGGIVAIGMALYQKLLTLNTSITAWISGIRSMVVGGIILVLAWTIGDICKELLTASYIVSITEGFLSAQWIPVIVFLAAGVIAFATGTSWGTMAILMPISIPLAYTFTQSAAGISESHAMMILLSTTASVLAGATFGDHCSPISDTTVMSSMASSADHIDHVRTQLPYALTTGGVACLLGYIPTGFGISNWIILPLGLATIFLVVRFIGKPVD